MSVPCQRVLSRAAIVIAAFGLVATGCSGALSRSATVDAPARDRLADGMLVDGVAVHGVQSDPAPADESPAAGEAPAGAVGEESHGDVVRRLAESVAVGSAAAAEDPPPRLPSSPAPGTGAVAALATPALDPSIVAAFRHVDPWGVDRALVVGDEGPDVQWIQRRLRELHFSPGEQDGHLGEGTLAALWALQKLAGLEPRDSVDAEVWRALRSGVEVDVLAPFSEPTRAEIDLDRQVMTVFVDGEVELVTHVSSGSGEDYCQGGRCRRAVTSAGDYRITRRIAGWRNAPLGSLYNPLYFNGGVAIHGSNFVPTWPDSHGCVRVPMHVADIVPALLDGHQPVHVVRPSELAAAPASPVAVPPVAVPPLAEG